MQICSMVGLQITTGIVTVFPHQHMLIVKENAGRLKVSFGKEKALFCLCYLYFLWLRSSRCRHSNQRCQSLWQEMAIANCSRYGRCFFFFFFCLKKQIYEGTNFLPKYLPETVKFGVVMRDVHNMFKSVLVPKLESMLSTRVARSPFGDPLLINWGDVPLSYYEEGLSFTLIGSAIAFGIFLFFFLFGKKSEPVVRFLKAFSGYILSRCCYPNCGPWFSNHKSDVLNCLGGVGVAVLLLAWCMMVPIMISVMAWVWKP